MFDNYRVWAEIDCDALRHNLATLRGELAHGTKVMAVLKANAYGHGAVPVARALAAEGLDAIGVGDSQEAIELRAAGIRIPILILGAIIPGEMRQVIAAGIQANLHSMERAQEMDALAGGLGMKAEVHLKVDTGMSRLGASPEAAIAILRRIGELRNLKLCGICTHFSTPGEADPTFSRMQLQRFNTVVDAARRLGLEGLEIHAASHAATLKYPEARFTMVRPGLALYGLTGAPEHPLTAKLQHVLSLRTQIIFLKGLAANTPVSYSRLHTTSKPTKIATLPIGYNDGFPVGLTGKSSVLVRGVRCPVVGRVTMDYIMVDVGAVADVAVGDEVTVIGRDGDAEIKLEELSGALGTVPYEVTCRLGRRVKRIYRDGAMALTVSGRNARAPMPGLSSLLKRVA